MTRVLTVLIVLALIGGAIAYRMLDRSSASTPEPEPAAAVVEEVPALAYEIMDEVQLDAGGRFADVLVESLSRDTPAAERERVARMIKEREKLKGVALYCSQEAMHADYSAAFARKNPEALECVLGSIDESGDAYFE